MKSSELELIDLTIDKYTRLNSYLQLASKGIAIRSIIEDLSILNYNCQFGLWYFEEGRKYFRIESFRNIRRPYELMFQNYFELQHLLKIKSNTFGIQNPFTSKKRKEEIGLKLNLLHTQIIELLSTLQVLRQDLKLENNLIELQNEVKIESEQKTEIEKTPTSEKKNKSEKILFDYNINATDSQKIDMFQNILSNFNQNPVNNILTKDIIQKTDVPKKVIETKKTKNIISEYKPITEKVFEIPTNSTTIVEPILPIFQNIVPQKLEKKDILVDKTNIDVVSIYKANLKKSSPSKKSEPKSVMDLLNPKNKK